MDPQTKAYGGFLHSLFALYFRASRATRDLLRRVRQRLVRLFQISFGFGRNLHFQLVSYWGRMQGRPLCSLPYYYDLATLPHLGKVTLESLQLHDVEDLSRFFSSLSPKTRGLAPGHPRDKKKVKDLCLRSLDPTYFGLVVRLAGGNYDQQVIAYGLFYDWHLDYPQLGIVVSDEFQGKGVGRLCMMHLVNAARIANKKGVWLSVFKHNQPARHLYESLGFNILGSYDRGRQWLMVLDFGFCNGIPDQLHGYLKEKLEALEPASVLAINLYPNVNPDSAVESLLNRTQYVRVNVGCSMSNDIQMQRLVNANTLALPFCDESFELVLLQGVLMHISPPEVDTAIHEVKRVAREHILVCEQSYSGQTSDGHGNVRINDFTFAYDYSRRFHAAGLFVLDHRSVEDLDAFLLKKRDAKYDLPERIDLDRLNPNHAHAIILRQIPLGVRVLDVGCATGYLGRYLTEEQGCTVDGVEYDLQAAEIARQYYRRVWVGDVEDEVLLADIPGPYDVVMCPAVLEHLAHPNLVLQRLRRLIAPGGFLVASLPNVAHWSVRWELLHGRWDYTEYGLLDRTHLRFYTLRTAQELLDNAGYRVEDVQWSNIGVGPAERVLHWLPRGRYRLRRWLLEKMPELFGYELIFVARRADDRRTAGSDHLYCEL